MRIYITAFFTFLIFLLTTCKKQDHCIEPPKKDSTCDLVQSYRLIDALPEDGGGLFPQFRKEYGRDGKVNKVVAGLYTLELVDSVSLILSYDGSSVFFIGEKHQNDTFLIATFDAKNRLQKIRTGDENVSGGYNPYATTEFYYDANRLSAYRIVYSGDTTRMVYDANGNIIRMYAKQNSTQEGTFFTYDLTVTAKRQFYSDNFINGGENAIFLAQYLGWLPDLEPVNRRTSFGIILDDDGTPYVLTGSTESDHVYDSNGNLVSYYSGGNVFTNTWACAATSRTAPN